MGLNILKAPAREEVYRDPTLPPRDGSDRPLILPVGGSAKRVPYARTSSVGAILEDTQALMLWKARMAAYGAATSFPDMLVELSKIEDIDAPDSKKRANQITALFLEAAGASRKAKKGTYYHELTEAEDRGDDLTHLPDSDKLVMGKYRALIARLKEEVGYEVLATELFGVNDEFKVAGTMDRIALVNGVASVVDNKFKGSMEYSLGEIAMQTCGYAGMQRYNDLDALKGIDDGRSPLAPIAVSQEKAYIIWIPQTGETAQFGAVDIAAAVDGFRIAREVREWRNQWKRKAFKFTPMVTV